MTSLTEHERHIIATIAKTAGLHGTTSDKIVATALGIQASTLRRELATIRSKIGVTDKAALVAWWCENGQA